MFIWIIFIILIIILSLIICGKIWKILSDFHHNNYSLCDFFFLTIYFIEQFLFLLLYNLYAKYRELWIGLIVLFVITTASLERFMMNSRQKKSSGTIRDSLEKTKDLLRTIDIQKKQLKLREEENKSLIDFIRKRLQKKH